MIISDSHGFVYLATPKTASSTIHRLLAPYGWRTPIDVYANHMTADAARRHPRMMGNLNWQKYKKITFIRNPWDRYVGLFLLIDKWRRHHGYEPYGSFERYIESGGHEGQHQDQFLQHRDGTWAVDFVGKFETLEEDIMRMFKEFGLPKPSKIFHDNDLGDGNNHRKHYTEYYTEKWMINAVSQREALVIDKFGYQYGDNGDRWK